MEHLNAANRVFREQVNELSLQLSVNRLATGAFDPRSVKEATLIVEVLKSKKEFEGTFQDEVKRHRLSLPWDTKKASPDTTYADRIRQLEWQLATERKRNKELSEAAEKAKKDKP